MSFRKRALMVQHDVEVPMAGMAADLVWGTDNTAPRFTAVTSSAVYIGSTPPPASGSRDLRFVIDSGTKLYSVYRDDMPELQNVPFADPQVTTVDAIRLTTSQLQDSTAWVARRAFEYVMLRPLITPEPMVSVVRESASPCP